MYDGKRPIRLTLPEQICADEEMASDVKFFARLNGRSIGGQIIYYVLEGLKKDKRRFPQGNSGSAPLSIRKTQGNSGERTA